MALLSWLLIVTACMFGLVSGIMQGMVMIQLQDRMHSGIHYGDLCGVRSHKWFGSYHAIWGLIIALALKLGELVYRMPPTIRDSLILAGSIVLLWELFEVGYAYARWNTLWDETEHLNFFEIVDIELTYKLTIGIHILRLIAGITLILTGSL